MKPLATLAAVMLLCAAGSGPGRAETMQSCTGFIESLPAIIGTQGVWCLAGDLSTAIASGNAIEITTNNVTLDCNGFKIGGLAAGLETEARGIYAATRMNLTVRNCSIRGFRLGIHLVGAAGGGHVIEDNRLDGVTQFGISVYGDGSVIQRNRVNDTGGTPLTNFAYGITGNGQVDVIDNVVDVVRAGTSTGSGPASGISVSNGVGILVSGNRVRGVEAIGAGYASGIVAITNMGRANFRDNHIVGNDTATSYGIRCSAGGSASRNFIVDHFSNLEGCSNDGGNVLK